MIDGQVPGTADTTPFFDASEVLNLPLERGAMVRIEGLVSRPELNNKIALVVGTLTDSGRAPCCIAPVLPTEDLVRVAAKPANLRLMPHPPHVMATAWNNLALAFKRAGALDEADGAYATSLELAPEGSSAQRHTLANWLKLVMLMAKERRLDGAEAQERMSGMMGRLFEPVTTLPELRGLDCVYGYDFVPGYSERQFHCGIAHSVDAQPAVSAFARQWVFDCESSDLVEISASGQRLPMSAAAQEALLRQPSTRHVEPPERAGE